MNIYTKPDIVDTHVKGNTIHVIWYLLSEKESLISSCTAQLKEVQKGIVDVIIIDMTQARGTPPMEVQKWFGEVLFPGFKANKQFKGLINILPSSAITKLGAKHWKKVAESDQFGFSVFETDSLQSAEKLAEEMRAQ